MEADARTTLGVVVTPQVVTATAAVDPVQLFVDSEDRVLVVEES